MSCQFFLNKFRPCIILSYGVFNTRKMATAPKIKTASGVVSGKVLDGTAFSKRKYFAYQGIPYAQSPVGNLRFVDPQPIPPWQGVFEAVQEGPECPQKYVITKNIIGQEDNCLVLNVYLPQLDTKENALPVMVYFHGGGFAMGSGNIEFHQGPDYWMERNIILVMCNYRLGAFGFLSLGTESVPGNAGLKDQVMVLRWVKENIKQFGGDCDNVTIFGESAGAASVHYHLLSPMSRGLFHRAIMLSGCSLNSWANSHKPVERAFMLGDKLGCKTSDPNELLTFLRTVPTLDIVKIQQKISTLEDKQDLRIFPFVPCVEPVEGAGERFLTENPRSLLEKGQIAPVPIIFGYNDKEGMMMFIEKRHTDEVFKSIDSDFSRIVPKDLSLPENATEKIKEFFFKTSPLSWNSLNAYFDYYTDVFFAMAIDESIKLHVAYGPAPVYCYYLKYDGGLGPLSHMVRQMYPNVNLSGVSHGDDLGYYFKLTIPGIPELQPDSSDSEMVSLITGLFENFAKNGNPNGAVTSIKWEPAVRSDSSWKGYLELNRALTMRDTRCEAARMEFWDSLKQPQSKL